MQFEVRVCVVRAYACAYPIHLHQPEHMLQSYSQTYRQCQRIVSQNQSQCERVFRTAYTGNCEIDGAVILHSMMIMLKLHYD